MGQLTLETLQIIDSVAERFEDSLRDARPLSIESLLTQVPDESAQDVFRHLLELQTDYMETTDDAYKDLSARFPQFNSVIEDVLGGTDVETVGPYRLVRPIGSGGVGVVYEAVDETNGHRVALKLLSEDQTGSAESLARFHREIETASRLNHPHVIRVIDSGQVNGSQYLAMELVDGADARRMAQVTTERCVSSACEVVRQAALGTQHAHDNGIIHRDLKPSNLMVGRDEIVRVLDLGLARQDTDSLSDTITQTGQVLGTIDYLAPEQAVDASNVDQRADVYALGATLYKLLCGSSPLSTEKSRSIVEKLTALAAHDFLSVGELNQSLPAELVAICDSMLSHYPADRPATAAAVAKQLAPFCEGHRLRELVEAAPAVEVSDTLKPRLTTRFPRQAREHGQRKRGIFNAAFFCSAAAVVAVAAGIAFRQYRGGHNETKAAGARLTAASDSPDSSNKMTVIPDVSDVVWQNREFTLRDSSAETETRCYFAGELDGRLNYNDEQDTWRLLPRNEHWVIQHTESGMVLTAWAPTEVKLKLFDAGPYQHWSVAPSSSPRRWAFQNAEYLTWLTVREGRIQLRPRDDTEGSPPAIDTSPQFEPPLSCDFVDDLWTVVVPESSDRPIDVLTSNDWQWSEPELLDSQINKGNPAAFPSVTPDGLQLMFGLQKKSKWSPSRVFIAKRQSLEMPFEVTDEIKLPASYPYGMHLHGSGRVLAYYSDETQRTRHENMDLFCRGITTAGVWQNMPIFDSVNSEWDEQEPTFSVDGLTLVFGSRRLGGVGNYDLWMSRRATTDVPFETPVHLGNEINTEGIDGYPTLSSDSLALIYYSERPHDGSSTLWMATRDNPNASFSDPEPLKIGGDPDRIHLGSSLALNGKLLIFCGRDKRNPKSREDLFYCRRIRF